MCVFIYGWMDVALFLRLVYNKRYIRFVDVTTPSVSLKHAMFKKARKSFETHTVGVKAFLGC